MLLGNECTCPVTYECIVKSTLGGVTLWNGTAFNCSQTRNSIKLPHGFFNESSKSSTVISCNSGGLVGWIDTVKNNSYISQLNVSVSQEIIGTNIKCILDNGQGHEKIIGQSLLGGNFFANCRRYLYCRN